VREGINLYLKKRGRGVEQGWRPLKENVHAQSNVRGPNLRNSFHGLGNSNKQGEDFSEDKERAVGEQSKIRG